MPIVTTLTRLFNETSEALGGSRANPAKRREIEDNSKRLGGLFAKLNSGDISKNASDKLLQLCQALDNGDFGTALQIQVNQLNCKFCVVLLTMHQKYILIALLRIAGSSHYY